MTHSGRRNSNDLRLAPGTHRDAPSAHGSAACDGKFGSLRVVLVSTQRGWHGGEEQAFLLARGLRKRGHSCLILARHGGAVARRMVEQGFEVATFSGNGRSPWGIAQIRRRLVRFRPHVVHMNDTHALTGAGLACWGLGVPARIVSRRVVYPIRSAPRYHYLCDRVIAVSGAVAEVCWASGIAHQQTAVVHDGVDPLRAASGDRMRGRRAMGISDDRRVLLTVATLTDVKGHKYLLDAMPEIVRRQAGVCLMLAGDGELTESLKKRAKRLGIDSRVHFLGYRRDIPDLIKAADLFVLPSCSEGLCTSLIDVMFAGRPIVTTAAGGIPDLLGDTERTDEPLAWVVPPRDSATLVATILEALQSPEQCDARQQRAQRRAQRLFTDDRMIDATLAVYREVLSQTALSRKAT